MRPLLPALVLAGALAGCTGEGSSVAPEADSTGGRPQLALTDVCYGECAYTAPLAQPTVAVYADGRVVAVDRSGDENRPVVRTGRVDRDRLAELHAKAVDAGMTVGGGSTTTLTTPVADGGGAVLTVRLRSTLTTVEVPLLGTDEPEADRYADPERVRKLAALAKELREVADLAEAEVEPTTYVVHARPAQGQGLAPVAWPGPPIGGFPVVSEGLRCGLVTGPPLAAVRQAVDGDSFGGRYTSGGAVYQVVARALLPHEQTCDDVRETVGGATASGPRYPGDTRPTP